MERAFATDPDIAQGVKPFEFRDGVWSDVKSVLIEAQLGKCAFCESSFDEVSHGDVEHFRPKGRIKQQKGQPELKPGYWWLAYAWSNYWMSCTLCNQRFKADIFPLGDVSTRARVPSDDLFAEDRLLIEPGLDEPSDFIEFDGPVIVPRANSLKGRTTITVLGLDRKQLNSRRLERWLDLKDALDAVSTLDAGHPARLKLETLLRRSMSPERPYCTMARDLIAREAPELLAS